MNPSETALLFAINGETFTPNIIEEKTVEKTVSGTTQKYKVTFVGYISDKTQNLSSNKDNSCLIKRIVEWKDNSGVKQTVIEYPDGKRMFNKSWYNRNTYTYKMSENVSSTAVNLL